MSDEYEKGYNAGGDMVWRLLLSDCLRHLGLDATTHERSLALLADYRQAMRLLCREFGDADYPDDLHPADVAEKYLARHLPQRYEDGESSAYADFALALTDAGLMPDDVDVTPSSVVAAWKASLVKAMTSLSEGA